MPVHIGEKHLKKGTVRKTYSDKGVKGFALRTTPNGSFTFYYQHLNKKTGKQDWHKIGDHPEWTIEAARNEARTLAGLNATGADIKKLRNSRAEQNRVAGTTFKQLHDEYINDCRTLVRKRWGMVPKKETWLDIQSALKRPLAWWGSMPVSEVTDDEVMKLYQSFVDEGHIPQANRIRTLLHTLFKWAAQPGRKYVNANPCATLPPKEEEPGAGEDGRVLDADEIKKFWVGLDDPKCPGDRLSKLALKLALVTTLRTGEVVAIERKGIGPASVTIPLAILKGRRSKKARDVVQPLNSLAREIIGEIFTIGDAERQYAFPGMGKRTGKWLDQKTLAHLVSRNSTKIKYSKMGISEYLGMEPWTPHALRRTSATILEQLGYDDATIGKVLTHKAPGKDAAPVTRDHYLVAKPIIARPVDSRIKALDDLDAALREIIGLKKIRLVA